MLTNDEIAAFGRANRLTIAEIQRLYTLAFEQEPPGDTDQMMHVRIRPLDDPGDPGRRDARRALTDDEPAPDRWAVDVGRHGSCQVAGEVSGDYWTACHAAVRWVLDRRAPLSEPLARYGDPLGPTAAIGRIGSEWWRWAPPELRVVHAARAWDTLEPIWNPDIAVVGSRHHHLPDEAPR